MGYIVCFVFSSRRRHTRWPRDWSSDVCSCTLPVCQLVDRDREDDEDAGHEVLVDDLDTDQRQTVPEDADDYRSDQCPDDRSAPAEQTRAAENDGRDRIEVLGGLTRIWIAELRSADEQPGGDSVHEPGDRVDAEQHPLDLDSGQPCGLRVVSDGIDMPPPGRLSEPVPDER